MSNKEVFAEDKMSQNIDRCFSDAFIKFGVGLSLGAVTSLIFFKRRMWPIYSGGFFGLGAAYQNCEKSLNSS
ncbi:hypothetical protein PVAND_002518 [Polypedilum vanderplanki]|uniref:MICOS complex subunit MIC10 n=1 Tax=Polypedilum vanderplanki TaxID=319348 RepID=A0A9J6BSE6_POLVA|nr:hypothetical protein PVAND_002518 [Polypedilum vanderplanki]